MHLSALCIAFLSLMIAIVPLSAETPKITEKQAKAIALKLHPGKIKSSELEKEHGIQLYSFDIETKEGIREIGIDANTFLCLNVERIELYPMFFFQFGT